MSYAADELERGAIEATGLSDFGSDYYREGLERTVDSLNGEADLNELGHVVQHANISNALIRRLKTVDTYRQHPEIDDEEGGGPVSIIGLPRTGTTAAHMYSLDALVEALPNAKFMRSHGDPAKVLASVCSLTRYARSWSSDRDDPEELGTEQVESWAEAVWRAMEFRDRAGGDRFADVSFADLQTDPVGTVSTVYADLGLVFGDGCLRAVEDWPAEHKPGARGGHAYELGDYGLTSESVREAFAAYLAAYDATA